MTAAVPLMAMLTVASAFALPANSGVGPARPFARSKPSLPSPVLPFDPARAALRVRGGAEAPKMSSGSFSSISKSLLAELLGTACIVALGCGCVANVNFASTGMGLLEIAIVFGLAVAGSAHMAGPISGAHFNPAISIALATVAKASVPSGLKAKTWLPLYIIAQCLGGFLGALFVAFMFSQPLAGLSHAVAAPGGVFGCYPNPMFGWGAALLSEVLGTALLAAGCISFGSPWLVGSWLSALVMVFAPYSGAGFNPARDLGPRLVAILWGFDPAKTMANYFSHYLFGTILGALLGMATILALKSDKE